MLGEEILTIFHLRSEVEVRLVSYRNLSDDHGLLQDGIGFASVHLFWFAMIKFAVFR